MFKVKLKKPSEQGRVFCDNGVININCYEEESIFELVYVFRLVF